MSRSWTGPWLLLVVLVVSGGCASSPGGPRAELKATAPEFGALGADKKWGHYRPYLQKMIKRIQAQWERLLSENEVSAKAGTSVKVGFRINAAGEIAEILAVEGTAGHLAQRACADAITSSSPYGRWTEEMKAMLGEQQEMTFTFHYQ